MSGPQAQFGIAITADDRTAKGAKSAEKRIGQIPKRAGDVTKKSQGILGTFAKIEEASAKAFGGKSLTSGLTKRLSAVREAASAAGTGLGEAATAGGTLSTAMTGMGIVAAGTVGVLAAAGYAAFKLADGWAQGAASIGRTAATIGVATKALQEFQAAGERAGVDKGASTSALGGVAQTFNDARYGRNPEALALMSRLGIKARMGADGQLDTVGMTTDLADAISRQKNAQTRRMIGSKFGISDAALPMFLNGGAAIRSDMKDADSTALVLGDDDIAKGKRIARKGAIVSQMKDRAVGVAGSAAAGGEESGYDAIISGGRGILAGATSFGGIIKNSFAPAAATIHDAATVIEKAGGNLLLAAREFFESKGWTREQASGIAANLHRESLLKADARGDGGAAYGIGQWHKDRQRNFEKWAGHSIQSSTLGEQLGFAQWELTHTEAGAGNRLKNAKSGYDSGSIVSRYYERPGNRDGEAHHRGVDAQRLALVASEQRHVHEIHVHDNRVTVKTHTKGSSSPVISTASVGRG